MKINRFWHKEESIEIINDKTYHIVSWGGSANSIDEAGKNARSRFSNIINRINGNLDCWNYGYLVPDIREPIFEQQPNLNNDPAWVITRNRYGSLVLNTGKVMFIDIDCQPLGCLLFFSKNRKSVYLDRIHDCLEKTGIDAAVYETHSGFRLLVTDREIDPVSNESGKIFSLFKADKLYSILCKRHACYRARLTPKPFRIGIRTPLISIDNFETESIQSWISLYSKKMSSFSVCKLVRKPARAIATNTIHEILKLHSSYCLNDNAPLA